MSSKGRTSFCAVFDYVSSILATFELSYDQQPITYSWLKVARSGEKGE